MAINNVYLNENINADSLYIVFMLDKDFERPLFLDFSHIILFELCICQQYLFDMCICQQYLIVSIIKLTVIFNPNVIKMKNH